MCSKIIHFFERSSPVFVLSPHSFDLPAAPWPAGLLCWLLVSLGDSHWILPTLHLSFSCGSAFWLQPGQVQVLGGLKLVNLFRELFKEKQLKKKLANTTVGMHPGKIRSMRIWALRQIHYVRDSWIYCPCNTSNPNAVSKINSSFLSKLVLFLIAPLT